MHNERQPDSAHDLQYVALGLGIVAVAFLLRIYHLGHQEFWVDEAASDFWARTSPLDFRKSTPLYLLLLKGWMSLAGDSEVALRFPSALFGTLFVAATIWFGRELFNSRVGLWSGLFAASSPIHIYYSQEARAYALVTLALLTAYIALWRALQSGSWTSWGLFSFLSLLTVYLHYLAILGLLAPTLLVWGWSGREGRLRRCLSYGTALLPSVTLVASWYLMRTLVTGGEGSSWVAESWRNTPPWLAIPKSLEFFGLGSEQGLAPIYLKQFSGLAFPPLLRMTGILLMLVIAVSATIPTAREKSGSASFSSQRTFLLSALFVPLLAMWLVSFVMPVYVAGRYDMMAFPVFPLLLGAGLAAIQDIRKIGPYLAAGVAVVFFSVIGVKLRSYYAEPPVAKNRATARTLHRVVNDRDLVIFAGLRGIATIYYLQQLGYEWTGSHCVHRTFNRRFGCRIFPLQTEERPGVNVSSSPEELRRDSALLMSHLTGREARLWLVVDYMEYFPRGLALNLSMRSIFSELARAGFRAPQPQPFVRVLGLFVFRKVDEQIGQ